MDQKDFYLRHIASLQKRVRFNGIIKCVCEPNKVLATNYAEWSCSPPTPLCTKLNLWPSPWKAKEPPYCTLHLAIELSVEINRLKSHLAPSCGDEAAFVTIIKFENKSSQQLVTILLQLRNSNVGSDCLGRICEGSGNNIE